METELSVLERQYLISIVDTIKTIRTPARELILKENALVNERVFVCANNVLMIYMHEYFGDCVSENKSHATTMRTAFFAWLLSPQLGHQNGHMRSHN